MSTFSGSLTFNGKEAKKGVVLPAFKRPLFSATMTVTEEIKAKQQIAFIGRLTKVVKAAQACGTQTSTNKAGIPLSEKFWDPKKAEMFIQMCATDFEDKFFVWGLAKGYERANLELATAGEDPELLIESFIMDIVEDAVYEDAMRMIWLNDVDITDVNDSPAGVLGSATDIVYYNLFDGLLKQIYAAVTAGKTPRYTISENAGVSYAAQKLAAGKSATIFDTIVTQADGRILDQPDQVIMCTKSIFDNWVLYRESKNLESAVVDQTLGIATAMFRGIKIIPLNFLDRYIKSDFDNGTTLYRPHIAIYGSLSSILGGFDVNPDAIGLEHWYDKDTKYNKIRTAFMIDAKVGFDEMLSVAY